MRRELDHGTCAGAVISVLHPDGAAPFARQLARDRQPEARPFDPTGRAAPVKPFEDRVLLTGLEARATVQHFNRPGVVTMRTSAPRGEKWIPFSISTSTARSKSAGAHQQVPGSPMLSLISSTPTSSAVLCQRSRARSAASATSNSSPRRFALAGTAEDQELVDDLREAIHLPDPRVDLVARAIPFESPRGVPPTAGGPRSAACGAGGMRRPRTPAAAQEPPRRAVIRLNERASERCSLLPSTGAVAVEISGLYRLGRILQPPDRAGGLPRDQAPAMAPRTRMTIPSTTRPMMVARVAL